MANDQSGADEPRFNVGESFWGRPLTPVPAEEDDQSPQGEQPQEIDRPEQGDKPWEDDSRQEEREPQPQPEEDAAEGQREAYEDEETLESDSTVAYTDLEWTEEDAFAEPELEAEPANEVDSVEPNAALSEADVTSDEAGASFDDALYIDASLNVYEEADDELPGLTMRGRRIRLIAVAVAVVAALACVYGLGVRRFQSHFSPNTSIKGHEVSGLTVEEATKSLEAETAGYGCEVSVGGFRTAVSGTDLSVERDEARIANDAKGQQSPFAWPLRLVLPDDLAVEQGVTYDDEALETAITQAVEDYNEQELPTSGASIDYDEEAGVYVLQGTVTGTALDKDAVLDAAKKSVSAFDTTSLPSEDEALRPATLEDLPRFAHAVEWANRSRTHDVPILVGGEQVAQADAWQCAEWVSIADGPTVAVDTDGIAEWAAYNVAEAVYHRDDWNDYYLDQEAFVQGLADRLATGNVDGYEAPTYDELRREGESRALAYERGGWNSELGRYIDVDLEAQFARLFDDKGEVIWESAFVSGSMYEAHSTVTGTFNIYAMDRGVTLVGLDYDNDGKPDYESYVDYWMPFYGGYGLHDATWRYNFGGNLYYYDGSHGCINLPYKKAEELYGMTFVGEVVNVHW